MKELNIIKAKKEYDRLTRLNTELIREYDYITSLVSQNPNNTEWLAKVRELSIKHPKLKFTDDEIILGSFQGIEDDDTSKWMCVNYYNDIPQDDQYLGITLIPTNRYDRVVSRRETCTGAIYMSLDSGKVENIPAQYMNLFEKEHRVVVFPVENEVLDSQASRIIYLKGLLGIEIEDKKTL